jgi:hypothetical protein
MYIDYQTGSTNQNELGYWPPNCVIDGKNLTTSLVQVTFVS